MMNPVKLFKNEESWQSLHLIIPMIWSSYMCNCECYSYLDVYKSNDNFNHVTAICKMAKILSHFRNSFWIKSLIKFILFNTLIFELHSS